jgi:uncharacterized protein (DUF362 family)
VKLHPLLEDPRAVLVMRTPLAGAATREDFRQAGARALAATGLVLEGENAVIKPNATVAEQFADPDSGVGTHPSFVHGMAEYLLAHGARRGSLYVLEDPRNANNNEPRTWRDTGYPEMQAALGVKLRCPTTYTCVRKTVPQPLCHPVLNVSRLAVAPTSVLINVPKLKTHNLAITTLCLKNLMGVVNVFDRHFCSQAWREIPEAVAAGDQPKHLWMDRALHEQWQQGLARRLIDVAQVVQPRLNIVEGIVARDGTGFNRGQNHAVGLSVAGVNMVAVDSVASYLMGFDPQALVYLRMATEAGLGTHAMDDLRVYCEDEGALVPCHDVAALRAQPPLRVISGITGEEEAME